MPNLSKKDKALRDMRRLLRTQGYSHDPINDLDVDLVAHSPDGTVLIVKVVEGRAGVLACQDAMKAMLDNGAREAIVLAPQGSTSAARRFVRKIRSRKGLHIHIWNDLHSAQIRMKEK